MDEFMMETPMSETGEPRQLVPTELEDFQSSSAGGDGEMHGEAIGGGRSGPLSHPLEAVFDVPVKVHAVLGRSRMEIDELMRLRSGDIVELDRRVGEPVDLFVNNRLIARGEVVLVDNSLGVTLTEIVRQDR
jgi:flagellar motor switch protein FliN/FliY